MALEHFNPIDEKILVFISDIAPSDEDKALAEEHGTSAFRYGGRKEWCYPIERHRYAVAVNPAIIPEGYRTFSPQGTVPETPVANPTQPPQKKAGKKLTPVISGEDI